MQITIGKIEAARHQIDTAIALWFGDGDPVSALALVCNALELTQDICIKQGQHDLTTASLFGSVAEPNEVANLVTLSRTPCNFIKHANRDTSAVLSYETGLVMKWILLVVARLLAIGEERSELQIAFGFWIACHHPEIISYDGATDQANSQLNAALRSCPKQEFLQRTLEALASAKRNGRL